MLAIVPHNYESASSATAALDTPFCGKRTPPRPTRNRRNSPHHDQLQKPHLLRRKQDACWKPKASDDAYTLQRKEPSRYLCPVLILVSAALENWTVAALEMRTIDVWSMNTSEDRELIRPFVGDGATKAQIATRLGISRATVYEALPSDSPP